MNQCADVRMCKWRTAEAWRRRELDNEPLTNSAFAFLSSLREINVQMGIQNVRMCKCANGRTAEAWRRRGTSSPSGLGAMCECANVQMEEPQRHGGAEN
jgi:hypothetical protein